MEQISRQTSLRTHTCGSLTKANDGSLVVLCGWVNRIRDHGELKFVDLRDQYGITQCVVEAGSDAFAIVDQLTSESVVKITGLVVPRTEDTINETLTTGHIEVKISEVEVLSKADELPMPVFGDAEYPEEVRQKNRFLDLRRKKMRDNIMLRSEVVKFIRLAMHNAGFTEFQTPLLTASSPEGARDFLVPSRLHAGKFYALPQAPQQFKQMIMASGFDRYFQIAPCFRDEDARADRSPGEFYQLDIEMAFVNQEDVFQTIEPILRSVFVEFGEGKPVTEVFPKIPYAEALRRFATDKPDLRNPMEFSDVSDIFKDGGFGLFAKLLKKSNNVVWALPAKGGGNRAFCDRMNNWAQSLGEPGLGYIFWREDSQGNVEGAGPIASNLGAEKTNEIYNKLDLKAGDAAFFIAGNFKKFTSFAAAARDHIANELGLVEKDQFSMCWITDFPMFERDEETGKIDFTHNPFSMPQGGEAAVDSTETTELLANQYDIVCNGVELSSGAIRNHSPELMVKLFEIAGYGRKDVEELFGGLFRAFHYGVPPHGGIAPGLDRIVMLLAGADNLRDVVLFPMNQQAQDLLMGAPSEVSDEQMTILGIRRALPKAK